MTNEVAVERPLTMAPRGWKHQIDQAIKRDVIRALVELILNSDDSYRNMERQTTPHSGAIEIRICRKHRGSVVEVVDEAEGIRADAMDNAVGEYGSATAAPRVRGFFGRGLKEAALGLGSGEVHSIRNGHYSRCALSWSDDEPRYRRYNPVPAQAKRNTTAIRITVDRADADIRMPQFDSIADNLERYFSLRDVMTNSNRRVTLCEVSSSGQKRKERPLGYSFPVAARILDKDFPVPGYQATFRLTLWRSDEPLTLPGEDDRLASGGLLIASEKGILALSLLKYNNNPSAARFFGRVDCPYLDELIEHNEPVLTATREVEGLRWDNAFCKGLRATIEEILKPYVEEEEHKSKLRQDAVSDERMRQRISSAVTELNAIAQSELGGEGTTKEPFVPEGGVGFVPEYVQILVGRDAALYLRSVTPARVAEGTIIGVTSDTDDVIVKTPTVQVASDPKHEGLGTARIIVEGRRIGAEAVVTAKAEAFRPAEALVKVIAKRPPPPPPRPQPPPRGLFRGVEPAPEADPRVRAFVKDSVIWVSTTAPTVKPYIGPALEGAYDTPQGQVMLAELIAEACCREIARQRVQKQLVAVPAGAEADAREREYRRLHNQYAHRIHEMFVQRENRRGRPTSAEMIDSASVPL